MTAGPVDWRVSTFSHLPSTQDKIREMAAEGEPEGAVVQALMQTAGRGRLGNAWISPLGNLYMSVLLRPRCDAGRAGQISFVAAVALSAAMDEWIGPGRLKTLKWPNDILIDGRKCAGILLESDLGRYGAVDALILGAGVNVLAPPPDRIGLAEVSPIPPAIHPFRDAALRHLSAWYETWRAEGFAPVREAWLSQAHGLGGPVTVRLKDRTLEGAFETIGADGALRFRDSQGCSIDISSGEIYFQDVVRS